MIFKVVAPIDTLYINVDTKLAIIDPRVLTWFDDNNIRPYVTMYKHNFNEPSSWVFVPSKDDDSILSYFFVFNKEKDAMLFILRWA